jgi:hypothetical protein
MTERTITSDVPTCPVCCKPEPMDGYDLRQSVLECCFTCDYCGAEYTCDFTFVVRSMQVVKSTEIKEESND